MITALASLDELRAFRPVWERLYTQSGVSNLFLTPEWLDHWYRFWAQEGLAVLVRWSDASEVPDALLPLYRRDGGWSVPDQHSYRPGLLAGAPSAAAWSELARAALALPGESPVGLRLWRCEDSEALAPTLSEALGLRRLLLVPRETYVSYLVDTSRPYDTYLASRPSKVRQEVRRKERALASARPDVQLLAYDDPAASAEAMAMLEEVERASWKAETGTALLCDQREYSFYRGVLAIRTQRTRPRLFVLAGAHGPLAHVLGLQHDRVFYALKTSYCLDVSAVSPGQMLFARVLRKLCDEDATAEMELLGSDSRWKRELATRTRAERTFLIFRPDARGAVGATCFHAASVVARARTRYPFLSGAESFLRRVVAPLVGEDVAAPVAAAVSAPAAADEAEAPTSADGPGHHRAA